MCGAVIQIPHKGLIARGWVIMRSRKHLKTQVIRSDDCPRGKSFLAGVAGLVILISSCATVGTSTLHFSPPDANRGTEITWDFSLRMRTDLSMLLKRAGVPEEWLDGLGTSPRSLNGRMGSDD